MSKETPNKDAYHTAQATPKDVIDGFFTEFPELDGKIEFLSYDTIEDRIRTRKKLNEFLKTAVKIDFDHKASKLSGSALKAFNSKRKQMEAGAQFGVETNIDNLLDNNMPFAAMLKDEDVNSNRRSSEKAVVYIGKQDTQMKDMLWGFVLTRFGVVAKMIDGQDVYGKSDSIGKQIVARAQSAITLPPAVQDDNQLRVFFLDHEIGHALSNHKISKDQADDYYLKNFGECVADAYATIRHYERFGRDSKLPEAFMGLRAIAGVVVPDGVHWTPRAMRMVIDLNEQGALDDMTPDKAVELAIQVAEKSAMPIEGVYNMNDAFKASVIRDTAGDFVAQKAKNALSNLFSDKAAKSKKVDIKDIAVENAVERLENIEATLEWAVGKALKTKSKTVFDAVEAFIEAVPQYWPNVDQDVLLCQMIRMKSVQNRPTTEPDMNLFQKGVYSKMKAKINA